MYKPPHPGQIVKKALIDNTDLTITAAAEHLGVKRVTLSNLINGKSGISPEMAIRLAQALNTSAEMWASMQTAYDLAQAKEKKPKIKVKSLFNYQQQCVHAY